MWKSPVLKKFYEKSLYTMIFLEKKLLVIFVSLIYNDSNLMNIFRQKYIHPVYSLTHLLRKMEQWRNPSSVKAYLMLRLNQTRTGAQQQKSLRWAANVWEWNSSRPSERSREEGGGPSRVAFREQPAQPAPAPASNSNTPWTASICTPWKGHTGQDGNELEDTRRGGGLGVVGTNLFVNASFHVSI